MGFLDIFFGKKKEEESSDEPYYSEETVYQPTITTHGGIPCDYCKEEINDHDKRRNFCKKSYHIKCLRKLKKDAKKVAFG